MSSPSSALFLFLAPTLVYAAPSSMPWRIVKRSSNSTTTAYGMICLGTIVAVVLIGLLVWGVWKWRQATLELRKRQKPFDYAHDNRSGMTQRSGELFGSTWSAKSEVDMSYPQPALAPSDHTLKRSNSARRNLVRDSILDEKHHRRMPNLAEESFFLEEDNDTGSPQTPGRKNSAHTLRIDAQAQERFDMKPPKIPDSPEAMRTRFSWDTKPEFQSMRSSLQSEPPKFRTVNSWVSHQARDYNPDDPKKPLKLRTEGMKLKRSGTGSTSTPQTPAVFRYHPGDLVSYQLDHRRMESSDIDRMIMSPKSAKSPLPA